MKLDAQQIRFVNELLHGRSHIILTGKAGTGKSTALCAGVNAAKAAKMDVLVMAPTAMAASIHRDAGLQSGTIHHALKWNPSREPMPRKLLSVCGYNTDWSAAPDQNRILVVDEASMVGLWMFEILARDLGEPGRPFDGRRLVLVGDWAQLPPVFGPDDQQMAKDMPELRKFGPADGCVLYHRIFKDSPPAAVVLEETHRANSDWFVKLNALRGIERTTLLSDLGMNFGDSRTCVAAERNESVHLCFRRVAAHKRNAERIDRLQGREVMLDLRDGEMMLKEGCEVIVTSNRAGGGYINGSRAIFMGMDSKGRVTLDNGAPISLLADGNWGHSDGDSYRGDEDEGRYKAQRILRKYGEVLEQDALAWLEDVMRPSGGAMAAKFGDGRVTFLPYWPILPGYAITVHKAQGASLESAVIEDDVFWGNAPARLPYVALSRVADEANVMMGVSSWAAKVRPDPAYPPIFSRIINWSNPK